MDGRNIHYESCEEHYKKLDVNILKQKSNSNEKFYNFQNIDSIKKSNSVPYLLFLIHDLFLMLTDKKMRKSSADCHHILTFL